MTGSGEPLRLAIASRLDALGGVRAQAKALALDHGFDPQAAEDFALCVHEAVSNAIVHGNREDEQQAVEVCIEPDDGGLRATVRNGGPGFDVAAAMAGGTEVGDRPRGRGMQIIRTLSDESEWTDRGRRLSFLKRR
ncbi:MAG: ATP-binding protein [Armatimonadetes bacterium]|nr:ATP-binding protein [Armatimonadota bacterium]